MSRMEQVELLTDVGIGVFTGLKEEAFGGLDAVCFYLMLMGYTQQEIAAGIGESQSNVCKRIRKVVVFVRKMLSDN